MSWPDYLRLGSVPTTSACFLPDSRCPFCGEEHEPGPVGEPGGPFAGIEFKMCPNVPEDHIYEDREYGTGPRGALHRLRPEDDDA